MYVLSRIQNFVMGAKKVQMIILKDVQKMQSACVIGIYGTNDFTGILMFRIKNLNWFVMNL